MALKLSGKQYWLSIRDYAVIVFGIFLYALGFTAFIFPEKVVIGGVTGLGTIIYFVTQKLFGTGVPVAVSQYALNLILLFFAYRAVGKQFVIRTVFGATVISLFIGLLTPVFEGGIIHGQPFMSVIIGSLMCGIGIGMVFTHNGSTGGTDIVAAMVSKHTNVSVGRTMLYCDMCIISSSYFIWHQVETVVYGFVTLVIVAYMADMIINTNRQAVQFTIFSKHWDKIATAINNKANRGCTVLSGMGWYSKQEVKVLLVMCRKIESVNIFRIIKSIDPNAFITQANVNGVYGLGFDAIKLKIKNSEAVDENPVVGSDPKTDMETKD
ncbi:MAG: YitT family protein [Paramuribaculum sp.]|nr:YitT family protein [Paramuribaculum sp.]